MKFKGKRGAEGGAFRKKFFWKKDFLLLFGLILVLAVLIHGTEIQSVEEYYLLHLDDVTPESETVTLSITCQTVFEHEKVLDPALREGDLLPSDGVILPPTEYVLREGDTVFDILSRAVRHEKIQMEFQGADKSPFGSVYIQGIHWLYEFSCGPLSGWMYRVDGEFPQCGCSRYSLHDGQCVEWIYTCELGKDIGAEWMGGQR